MASSVNIHDAKSQLSKLLERVQQGDSVVIAKAGVPVATLGPLRTTRTLARPGSLKGQDWTMSEDFDAPVEYLFDALGPNAVNDGK